jgi:hypothetical protein
VQRAALAAGEARTVEEDAGALVHGGLAVAVLVDLDPVLAAALVVELPRLRRELLDVAADPLLVVLVGEVRAQRAAAVVRPVGVDPLAALAEDAGPARRQPREVAAEHLGVVGRVGELDPGARKDEVDFGHGAHSTSSSVALRP